MGKASLLVLIEEKLFGICLSELRNLGIKEDVNWELRSESPLFCVDLPDMMRLNHFVFDYKIYVAGEGLTSWDDPESYDDAAVSPFKFYEFDMDKKKFTLANSIPSPPEPYDPIFMGNISDTVYLLVYVESSERSGFWVLSGSGKWEPLPHPAPLDSPWDFVIGSSECFTLQDKLFFLVRTKERRQHLYSFDPATVTWKQIEYGPHNSWIDSGYCKGVMLSLPVPGGNTSVALTWSHVFPENNAEIVSIQALLVNNKDLAVCRSQSLCECLEGIQPPSYFGISTIRAAIVDLGDGMVCALVYGLTPDHVGGDSPVLCMSVFTLALAEPDTEASKEEHEFLSVRVIVKRVIASEDLGNRFYDPYPLSLIPFMFRPEMELPHWSNLCFKDII